MLLIQTIVFSQESVASLTKTIEKCQLDSTSFWLKKQAKIVKNTKDQKENIINHIDYFLKIRDFDSATFFLNEIENISEINSDLAIYYYYKGRINRNNRKPKKAKEDFLKAIKIAKDDSLILGKVYNALFITYYTLNNQDSTYISLLKADQYLTNQILSKEYAIMKLQFGVFYLHQLKLDLAIESFFEALSVSKKINDYKTQARVLNLIASVYSKQNRAEEALNYMKEAYPLVLKYGDNQNKLALLLNIGEAYLNLNNKDTALVIYTKVLTESKNITDLKLKSLALLKVGIVYDSLGDRNKALNYFIKSNRLNKLLGNKREIAVSFYNIGMIYSKLGEFNEGLKYIDSALFISKQVKNNENIMSCYLQKAKLMKDSSSFFYQKYKDLKDSLFNKEVEMNIAFAKIMYDNKQKVEQNQRLNQKLKIEKQEKDILRYQNNQYFFFTIILVISLFFLTYFFYNKNNNQKKKIEIVELSIENAKKKKELLEVKLINVQEGIKNKNKMVEKLNLFLSSDEAINQLLKDISTDKDWSKFIISFELLYPSFFIDLNAKSKNDLTKNDYRIAALIHLNLTIIEMSDILFISESAVKKAKYRLNKKLTSKE